MRNHLGVWLIAASASLLGACGAGREAAPPVNPTSIVPALAPYGGASTPVRSSAESGPASIPALEPAPTAGSPSDDNPYRLEQDASTAKPVGHQLLAIDPKERPYRVLVPRWYTADGQEYRARLRICVSADGGVSRVDIVEPSIPAIDSQLPVVIPRWRYHPYVVDGRARPFCYVMNYRVG